MSYHGTVILRLSPPQTRWFGRARFWALALVGLVVGHDAVFIGQTGSLAGGTGGVGHGYWLTFAMLSLVLAAGPLLAALSALAHITASLGAQERTAHVILGGSAGARAVDPVASYVGDLTRLFPRLFIVIAVGFAVQENLEHVASGQGLPGLWALSGPEYPLAIPILGVISLALGMIGAWMRVRTSILRERLATFRAIRRRLAVLRRAAPVSWRSIAAIVAHGWLLARGTSGRAPPVLAGPPTA